MKTTKEDKIHNRVVFGIYIFFCLLIFFTTNPQDITIGNNPPGEGVYPFIIFISLLAPFVFMGIIFIIYEFIDTITS